MQLLNYLVGLFRKSKLALISVILLPLLVIGAATHNIPVDTIITGSMTSNSVVVDNITIDGNTITSTDTDGNITLTPDGSGGVFLSPLSTGSRFLESGASGEVLESGLTTTEGDQLENINSTTISSTQWGYLGDLDQALTTTDSVSFAQLDVDNIRIDGSSITTTSGDLEITASSDVKVLEDNLTVGDASTSGARSVTFSNSTGNVLIRTTPAVASRTWTIPDATDTFVGKSTTDTFSNKTINATAATGTNTVLIDASDASYDNGTSGLVATDAQDAIDEIDGDLDTHAAATAAHGVSGDVVGTSDAQTLTNKTFDDELILQQISTPSNPSSSYNALYFKSDNNLYKLDSSGTETEIGSGGGSGEGGINFITNSQAESDTTGWATYDDTASATPTDGSGGSPSAITFNRTTTSSEILRGDASFEIAKTAADGQGEGASYDFSIDAADKGKFLNISFEYKNSANYVSGDLKVYVYDVTNTKISVLNDDSGDILYFDGESTQFLGGFQTATNSTSYRLIFHVTSTNANAWDMFLDSVKVTPEASVPSAIITKWEDYTPTTQGIGTPSFAYAKWRQVGDSVEIQIKGTTGTVTASEFQIGLPNSVTADDDYSLTQVGYIERDAGVVYKWSALATGGDSFLNMGRNSGAVTNIFVAENGSSLFGSSEDFSVNATIKIQGWDSGAQISTTELQYKTAVVTGAGNGGTSITANTTNVDFTEVSDKHGLFDGTTFTAPKDGQYLIAGAIRSTSGATPRIDAYIGGTKDKMLGVASASTQSFAFSGILDLSADDTVTIRSSASMTLSNDTDLHWISIKALPDYSTFAQYHQSQNIELYADQPTGHGSTNTKIRTGYTVQNNTLGDYATYADTAAAGASVTVNVSGNWSVAASDRDNGASEAITITVNDSAMTTLATNLTYAEGVRVRGFPNDTFVSISDVLYLNAGDVVRVHTDGGADATQILAYFRMSYVGP